MEYTEYIGIPLYARYQFELCEDGFIKFDGNTSMLIDNDVTWNWRITSNTEIELYNDDDDILVFKLDGNYLVLEESGDLLYLEKVDDFTPYQYEEKTKVIVNDLTHEKLIGKWQGMYSDASPMLFQFEFNEDGIVSFGEIFAEYHEGDGIYKWQISGNDINVISADGEQNVFNYRCIESDEENPYHLTYNCGGDKIDLEKVDEFVPVQ